MRRAWRLVLVALSGCLGAGGAPARLAPAPALSPVASSATRLPPVAPPVTSGRAAPAPRPRFTLHVVDVGTGLGIFVEGPDFSLVYDAGSNDDTALGASNRFVAYLRAIGPKRRAINHVVLSHAHRDHVELLPDVLAAFSVAELWEPGAPHAICGYRRLLDVLSRSPGTRYHTAAFDPGPHTVDLGRRVCRLPARVDVTHSTRIVEGTPVALGDRATMTFLHVDGMERVEGPNANSLVTLLTLDGAKVLLMGDAEAGGRESPSARPARSSVEGYVLARHRALIDADVLVAGHHGSKTSSRRAFVEAVSPRISVISSGPARYGRVTLPDEEVVEELRAAGELLRTDADDAACAVSASKIGPDADGQPGGCDNVVVELSGGAVRARYSRVAD
ncbi:MAG: MBL fold metallo-hydrolase [Polyangiaceae bacterium]|nr:MBL fold metallo-hydrolase [Polyangiaceae bacterium]